MRINIHYVIIFIVLSMFVLGCTQTIKTATDNQTTDINNDLVEKNLTQNGCAYNNPNCDTVQDCVNNSCIPKKGCDYDNPPCETNYTCMNNSCALKTGCKYSNPNCNDTSECVNNNCVLKPGCQYNNPTCNSEYDCITNSCVKKKGCSFDNPSCDANQLCVNNNCVLKTGCQYSNPPCSSDYDCADNQCTLKQGCQYSNPSCNSGYNCENNTCIKQATTSPPSSNPPPPPAENWNDLSSWTEVYNGYGTVTVNGKDALLYPLAAMSADETHAALITNSDPIKTNFTIRMKINNIQQLRQNSPPNPWEVGWILFNYQDASNFYYFIPKTNGIELGTLVNGGQVFLVTENDPKIVVGQPFDLVLNYTDGLTKIYINGQQVINYSEVLPGANKIALYCEDSKVEFYDIQTK